MSEKIYVTTPIYYVNDKPHIGHAYTSVATDFLARYHRIIGNDVRFQTGTDEHGLKIQKAAEKENVRPIDLCDKNSAKFRELSKILNISNNDFIRTTEDRHIKGAQFLWNKLYENDQIYLDEYTGWYSVSDETFYNEKDLIKDEKGNFKTTTGGNVEWISEKSYFFRLSNWSDKLLEYYKNNPDFIMPASKRKEVVSFVSSGLRDLSVSRTSFNWGIKTPNDNNHIMYVWLDALTCYPNGVKYLSDEKENVSDYWENTTHIVGKDILRHHAVYWPAFLMAANLKLPKRIFAHGWWTNEGNKISKSLGNAIDPIEIIDKYGLDQFRYFMLREVPFGNDGDFSIKALEGRINSDLANDLGNLCQRSLSMAKKHLNNEIQCISLDGDELKILKSAIELNKDLTDMATMQNISDYIKAVWELINISNKYFNECEPWKIVKTDMSRFNKILFTTTELIKIIAIYTFPIMPQTSEKIFNFLNIDKKHLNADYLKIEQSKNYKLNTIEALFPRIN